jgi:hypothetical protein
MAAISSFVSSLESALCASKAAGDRSGRISPDSNHGSSISCSPSGESFWTSKSNSSLVVSGGLLRVQRVSSACSSSTRRFGSQMFALDFRGRGIALHAETDVSKPKRVYKCEIERFHETAAENVRCDVLVGE